MTQIANKHFKSLPLKIKYLNLAAEVRIIKNEEKRIEGYLKKLPSTENTRDHKTDRVWAHTSDLNSIRGHRYCVVKPAARDALLAYGFLRGRSYLRMEPKRFTDPNWAEIERMILKYGKGKSQDLKQSFAQWKSEAGECAK